MAETFRYQNRRASAATWTALNPVLLAGEIGVEKDTDRFKIGDGVTAWNDLPYYTAGDGGGTPTTAHVPLTTVVGGVPELVWDADDSLVLTEVPL